MVCVLAMLGAVFKNKIKVTDGVPIIKKRKLSIVLTMIPLLLISVFRYGVGSDYFEYERLFNEINATDTNRYEFLFSLLNRFIYKLGMPFHGFIVIAALIFVILVILAIHRDSPYIALSIFLLFSMSFFFQSLNIVRQMVGCAICLYSIKYIEEKKIIKYVTCMVLAFGFHSTSIIFIPVYFLFKIKLDLKKAIPILGFIFLIQGRITDIVNNYAMGNINYAGYIDNLSGTASSSGYISLTINIMIYVFAYLVLEQNVIRERGYLNIQLAAVALSMMNGKIPLLNRLRFFYTLPGIILIPIAINKIKSRLTRIIAMVAISVLFFAYCLYIEGYMNQSASYPYYTILNYMKGTK